MPIADAIAIVFVMPFILMFLGKIIFGNLIGPRRIYASMIGFLGALLVIQPSLSNYGLVALFPLGCAVTFSFYEMATQAMSNRVHPVTMQLHTSIAGSLITLPLLWLFNGSGLAEFDPVTPDALNWLWLFGVGFWAAVSPSIHFPVSSSRPCVVERSPDRRRMGGYGGKPGSPSVR